MRFMGDAAAFAYLSMEQAIADSGLTEDQVSNDRTGIVAGSGGASSLNQVNAVDIIREKALSALVHTWFHVQWLLRFLLVLLHHLKSVA